eukprot:520850_1
MFSRPYALGWCNTQNQKKVIKKGQMGWKICGAKEMVVVRNIIYTAHSSHVEMPHLEITRQQSSPQKSPHAYDVYDGINIICQRQQMNKEAGSLMVADEPNVTVECEHSKQIQN